MSRSGREMSATDGERINIKLHHQDKGELGVQIKGNCRLFKVLATYCERFNLDYKTMRFVYDGCRVRPTHTPNSLHMRDGDRIDVLGESTGGGGGDILTTYRS